MCFKFERRKIEDLRIFILAFTLRSVNEMNGKWSCVLLEIFCSNMNSIISIPFFPSEVTGNFFFFPLALVFVLDHKIRLMAFDCCEGTKQGGSIETSSFHPRAQR